MFLSSILRGAASATVRTVKKRSLIPTKTALTLVSSRSSLSIRSRNCYAEGVIVYSSFINIKLMLVKQIQLFYLEIPFTVTSVAVNYCQIKLTKFLSPSYDVC